MPWPYDPTDNKPATGIDWTKADQIALKARPNIWRKVAKNDAVRLSTDPKYASIFATLPEHAKRAVFGVCGEVYETEEYDYDDPKSARDDILGRLETLMSDADDAGNLTAKARAIEIMAKVQKLFETHKLEDRQVTIKVVTGVERELVK
jgi:hypothetical protein